eukprot:gnl/MRDRNA2_/MRDRNA2_213543_c0_seq1.p2 gnl/MRDRNA2_/MRDRNA2_213543_c0~~gnl/MRDRNA2_/MRDRNA2_213543_c0_seq1.p2  ORF type:complete len:109 (+),score=7.16 gnl/MRDRNA2_/MRDRNA2_213543_c0_seq1:28-354(+)
MVHSDRKLFAVLVREMDWGMHDFDRLAFTNIAWAFATVGEPVPAPFDCVYVPDTMATQDASVTCSLHPAVLCAQIKEASTIEMLCHTFSAHKIHLNHLHLAASWTSLG